MSWQNIYSAEEIETKNWAVINETSLTGHPVLDGLGQRSAEFYAELMNEVYNQVYKDLLKRVPKVNLEDLV